MRALNVWYHLLVLVGLELGARATVPSDISVSDSFQNCTICLETVWTQEFNFTVTMIPNCRHTFHSECILEWIRNSHDTCPTCRGHIGRYLEQYLPPQQEHQSRHPNWPIKVAILIWISMLSFVLKSVSNSSHPVAIAWWTSPAPGLLLLSLVLLIFILFSI